VSTPVFIDAAYAADLLHVTPDDILDLVRTGQLRTYGGRSSNPFLRSADVLALAGDVAAPAEETRGRQKSPAARVRQRLTADARWGDVSVEDIEEWARRADPVTRQAGRKTAETALSRLQRLLAVLDEDL